jgi:hypothetical protein
MDLTDLKRVVDDYKAGPARWSQDELGYFASIRTIDDSIAEAALSRVGGVKLSHQRRIPIAVLENCRRQLLMNRDAVRRSRLFDDLFDLVDATIGPIHGAGELLVYDVALRIGARLQLSPQRVYLHAGSRKGARALNLRWREKQIEMTELPPALRELSAHQVEDVLCIYKDDFAQGTLSGLAPGCGPTATSHARRGC